MKTTKIILVALLVLSVTALQAQKTKIEKGDLTLLKGQTEVLLEYDYSSMAVGKFDKEEDYVNKKVSDYNAKKPGSGDEWKIKWEADRAGRFQPKFEELLNNYTSKVGCNLSEANSGAQYTLILKTTFIEPGWNIGISRSDAFLGVEIIVVETANPDNQLIVITMDRIPGRDAMGNDYDTGLRIQEAYAKCGKELGALLAKKAFK